MSEAAPPGGPDGRDGPGPTAQSAMAPGGWLFPYWLERQLDPASPDFTPAADHRPAATAPARPLPGGLVNEPENSTNRDWTLVGSLGSWRRATVDPRGLVTPLEGGWSLDWWVGAEDRWHLPSREAAVRQRLVDNVPVVETVMRVPGGDIVHRAFGVRPSSGECVVIEIENASAVPVAVAVAVRPYHSLGFARVDEVALDASGSVVVVDGAPAVVFPKRPARAAASTLERGDCAAEVLAGAATEAMVTTLADADDRDAGRRDPHGFAHAAFVFPLAHTAVLRLALPLERPTVRGGPRSSSSRAATALDADRFADLPDATRVASGWVIQSQRGASFEVPDPRLREAIDRARRHLLLVHGGEDVVVVPDRGVDYAEMAAVLGALDVLGYADEVEQVLSTWPERQQTDGWFAGRADRGDANGAALHAVAEHWRLTRTLERTDEHALLLARAAHAIDKRLSGVRRRRGRSGGASAARHPGFLAAGEGPSAGGPRGVWVRDGLWSWQGLTDAAELLEVLDQSDAAADVAEQAARLGADLSAALASMASSSAGPWPAALDRPTDGGIIANLDAVNLPLTLRREVAGRDETIDAICDRFVVGGGVHQAVGPAGLSARYTAMLARVAVHTGRVADEQLAWLLTHASPTGGWPETQHPTRGGGTTGAGHDGVATAWFLRLVRDMLVRETADGVALCTHHPRPWLGQGLEVHDAPTAFGRMSFAIRWHGERPALLWELERHDDLIAPVRLSVPGLDPSWSSLEPKGEALLGVPPSAGVRAIDPTELEGESFA